jgi:D-alanyl-lipoteichoic acid acyltransferase DltB (MBOAT superfamily)
MNWKPVYAVLIFLSTFITWLSAILVELAAEKRTKRIYLSISLILNFGVLFLYKYFDFINESVRGLLESVSLSWPIPNLDLLLPVGISFYTFQAVGYTIDVYRGDLRAEKHFGYYTHSEMIWEKS